MEIPLEISANQRQFAANKPTTSKMAYAEVKKLCIACLKNEASKSMYDEDGYERKCCCNF